MSGTIEIKKMAIRDPNLIEWIENRELYEIWEEEQKKGRKATAKAKPKSSGTKAKKAKTASKKDDEFADNIVERATKPAPKSSKTATAPGEKKKRVPKTQK